MAVVRDILARKGSEVVTAAPEDSVLQAAQRMNTRGIGALPVVQAGNLVGIFTERDVMRRVVAEGRDPERTTLLEVMTSRLISTTPEMGIDECGALMTAQRIRHLPVRSPSGELLGIITIGDLLAYQLADQAATIAQLNSYVYDNR